MSFSFHNCNSNSQATVQPQKSPQIGQIISTPTNWKKRDSFLCKESGKRPNDIDKQSTRDGERRSDSCKPPLAFNKPQSGSKGHFFPPSSHQTTQMYFEGRNINSSIENRKLASSNGFQRKNNSTYKTEEGENELNISMKKKLYSEQIGDSESKVMNYSINNNNFNSYNYNSDSNNSNNISINKRIKNKKNFKGDKFGTIKETITAYREVEQVLVINDSKPKSPLLISTNDSFKRKSSSMKHCNSEEKLSGTVVGGIVVKKYRRIWQNHPPSLTPLQGFGNKENSESENSIPFLCSTPVERNLKPYLASPSSAFPPPRSNNINSFRIKKSNGQYRLNQSEEGQTPLFVDSRLSTRSQGIIMEGTLEFKDRKSKEKPSQSDSSKFQISLDIEGKKSFQKQDNSFISDNSDTNIKRINNSRLFSGVNQKEDSFEEGFIIEEEKSSYLNNGQQDKNKVISKINCSQLRQIYLKQQPLDLSKHHNIENEWDLKSLLIIKADNLLFGNITFPSFWEGNQLSQIEAYTLKLVDLKKSLKFLTKHYIICFLFSQHSKRVIDLVNILQKQQFSFDGVYSYTTSSSIYSNKAININRILIDFNMTNPKQIILFDSLPLEFPSIPKSKTKEAQKQVPIANNSNQNQIFCVVGISENKLQRKNNQNNVGILNNTSHFSSLNEWIPRIEGNALKRAKVIFLRQKGTQNQLYLNQKRIAEIALLLADHRNQQSPLRLMEININQYVERAVEEYKSKSKKEMFIKQIYKIKQSNKWNKEETIQDPSKVAESFRNRLIDYMKSTHKSIHSLYYLVGDLVQRNRMIFTDYCQETFHTKKRITDNLELLDQLRYASVPHAQKSSPLKNKQGKLQELPMNNPYDILLCGDLKNKEEEEDQEEDDDDEQSQSQVQVEMQLPLKVFLYVDLF